MTILWVAEITLQRMINELMNWLVINELIIDVVHELEMMWEEELVT
jgi:hypothetical protein